MTDNRRSPILPRLAKLIIAATLLYAGLSKALHLDEFLTVLDGVPFLPSYATLPLSQVIVASELSLPILLYLRPVYKIAIIGSAVLSLTFLSYSMWRLLSKTVSPCGCFAGVFTLSPLVALLVDLTLLAGCAYLLRREYIFQA